MKMTDNNNAEMMDRLWVRGQRLQQQIEALELCGDQHRKALELLVTEKDQVDRELGEHLAAIIQAEEKL